VDLLVAVVVDSLLAVLVVDLLLAGDVEASLLAAVQVDSEVAEADK
jgi:hypothetical protein